MFKTTAISRLVPYIFIKNKIIIFYTNTSILHFCHIC